jgi:tRNA(adenine34) deaminase
MNQDQIISELYKLSLKAYQNDEVPIACVIVKNKKIVSKAYNLREKHKNPLYHAEVLAINKLCKKINNWRLDEYEMYVTLKPCKMCMEIIKESRIKKVYYILDSINEQNKKLRLKKINLNSEKFKSIITSFFKEKR